MPTCSPCNSMASRLAVSMANAVYIAFSKVRFGSASSFFWMCSCLTPHTNLSLKVLSDESPKSQWIGKRCNSAIYTATVSPTACSCLWNLKRSAISVDRLVFQLGHRMSLQRVLLERTNFSIACNVFALWWKAKTPPSNRCACQNTGSNAALYTIPRSLTLRRMVPPFRWWVPSLISSILVANMLYCLGQGVKHVCTPKWLFPNYFI